MKEILYNKSKIYRVVKKNKRTLEKQIKYDIITAKHIFILDVVIRGLHVFRISYVIIYFHENSCF